MAKNYITLICLLFCYSCIPLERGRNEVITKPIINQIPLIITKTDTVFITIEIPLTMAQKYIEALKKYIGVKELTGKNDGPEIVAILKSCGINIPAPWCACYLNQGLLDIGLMGPAYQPGFTPRWFEDVNRITWTRVGSDINQTFEPGWIGGIWFRNLGRIGHIACILEDFGDGYVLTIEGNANSAGGREGNRVSLLVRHKSEFYIMADWLKDV